MFVEAPSSVARLRPPSCASAPLDAPQATDKLLCCGSGCEQLLLVREHFGDVGGVRTMGADRVDNVLRHVECFAAGEVVVAVPVDESFE